MADPELAALRAARLNQLQSSAPGGGGPGSGGEEDAAKRQNEEQMRLDLLATVLDSAARERCTPFTSVSIYLKLIVCSTPLFDLRLVRIVTVVQCPASVLCLLLDLGRLSPSFCVWPRVANCEEKSAKASSLICWSRYVSESERGPFH